MHNTIMLVFHIVYKTLPNCPNKCNNNNSDDAVRDDTEVPSDITDGSIQH